MGTMSFGRPKRAAVPSVSPLHAVIVLCLLFTALVLVLAPAYYLPTPSCTAPDVTPAATAATSRPSWSGDLRLAEFSWNRLRLPEVSPPPERLRIAVFSRKWPATSTAPGGMERHALTLLHGALSRRGHEVHVFTAAAAPPAGPPPPGHHAVVHALPGRWRSADAWAAFRAEDAREPFDVVHSEGIALPHHLARGVPNLAVTWHGIALEALQSNIYQALAAEDTISAAVDRSLREHPAKVVEEIRFFKSYTHHVAVSDSGGEMLRDVYQIPAGRVHVVLNGVDDEAFGEDGELGEAFRAEIGVPRNASLVMGVAGRLVRDRGHPLLHEAVARLLRLHEGVYLVAAGTGPWAQRYAELGRRVVALGALPPRRRRAFYNAVDVLVNPTLRPQGLDPALMEAMRCGTPVAATRLPSIRGSVVVDGELGHMFAPNVESLLVALEAAVREGPRRMAERGRACRAYAATMFGAGKTAAAYERLFLCIKNESYCSYPRASDG